jgi:membrane associated rhomboid family serine protease
MSDTGSPLTEEILRHCAEAAPRPWFPRNASPTEVKTDQLEAALQELWLHGLILREGGSPELGPGFRLSPEGQALLNDPEGMQRLRAGTLPTTRTAQVRQALLQPKRPVVTQVLVVVCVLWFLAGLVLAFRPPGIVKVYLLGFMSQRQPARYGEILEDTGIVRGQLLVQGEWWRLLTSGFVHIGVLHILMNLYVLYQAGRYVESMWGSVRYLVIYAFSLWGGSCLAMACYPLANTAGASGAICGVLAAEAVWVFLNGKSLPRSIASQARSGIIFTAVIIIAISFVPGVSGWGHLGGAVAGGVTALAFQLEKFGPAPWRWLGLVALVPIPWLSYRTLDYSRHQGEAWSKIRLVEKQARLDRDDKDFTNRFLARKSKNRVPRVIQEGLKGYEAAAELLNQHPTRRDPDKVKEALDTLAEERQRLQSLAQALQEAGPYENEVAEKARTTGREWANATDKLLELAERFLKGNKDDEAARNEQKTEVMKREKAFREQLE